MGSSTGNKLVLKSSPRHIETSSKPWNYFPELCVVSHDDSYCQICTAYRMHLQQAYVNVSNDPSLQRATAEFCLDHHPPPAAEVETTTIDIGEGDVLNDHGEQFFIPAPILSELQVSSFTRTPSRNTDISELPKNRTYSSVVNRCAPQSNSQPTEENMKAPTTKSTQLTKSTIRKPSLPQTCNELQKLNKRALRGDGTAISMMQKFCFIAHAVSPKSRTPAQKLALYSWRNPRNGRNGLPNPREDSPPEEWFKWYSHHSGTWPKGVRRDPQTGRPVSIEEIKVWRTCARLRPIEEKQKKKLMAGTNPNSIQAAGNSSVRWDFEAVLYPLLASGNYVKLVQQFNIKVASKASFRRYEGPYPCTELTVSQHLAENGVALHTASNNVMTEYAQRCLNGRSDGEGNYSTH